MPSTGRALGPGNGVFSNFLFENVLFEKRYRIYVLQVFLFDSGAAFHVFSFKYLHIKELLEAIFLKVSELKRRGRTEGGRNRPKHR